MNMQKEAAMQGGIEKHFSDISYNRYSRLTHTLASPQDRFKSCLKSTIIWFPTHGLVPLAVGDWLIRFFKLRAA